MLKFTKYGRKGKGSALNGVNTQNINKLPNSCDKDENQSCLSSGSKISTKELEIQSRFSHKCNQMFNNYPDDKCEKEDSLKLKDSHNLRQMGHLVKNKVSISDLKVLMGAYEKKSYTGWQGGTIPEVDEQEPGSYLGNLSHEHADGNDCGTDGCNRNKHEIKLVGDAQCGDKSKDKMKVPFEEVCYNDNYFPRVRSFTNLFKASKFKL